MNIKVRTLDSGRFRLDGGAMFGVVPKVLWEKTNPGDDKNRIEMALRCLVVESGDRKILVDSGIGTGFGEKASAMYAIDHSKFRLSSGLEKLGLTRESITDLVITHLHFDHVGGATFVGAGGPELMFPNAEIWVQEENISHAHAPTEKDRASFIEHTLQPLLNSKKLQKLRGGKELIPGVEIIVHHGHTPGQQLVKVTSSQGTYLFCGDTIPTSSHIPVPYVMAYDLYPVQTIKEKKALLPQAVAENWTLVFAHDPFVSSCKVIQTNGRFARGEIGDV